jgi:23S rRNA (uracil1939-C5)-methyltransferase
MSNPQKEKAILRIENVVYRGMGLGRMEGLAVFIPGTITGELVEIEIAQRKKNFARGSLLRILEPSANRITPSCPLTLKQGNSENRKTFCPGCTYQHIEYSEEIRLKSFQLNEMLRYKIGEINDEVFLPAVLSPLSGGYRNKITLHARRDYGSVILGYFGEDNRTVIDVPECPLAETQINLLLKDLRSKSGFLASIKDGEPLILRFTPADGAHYKASGAYPTKSILSEKTFIGTLKAPFSSFFQVNRGVADLLVKNVSDIFKSINPRFVIDLYCGIGVFGLAAAKAGSERIIGIDNAEDSISAARENAGLLGIDDIEFITQSSDKGLSSISGKMKGNETCMIIDPPRSGLEKSVIDRVLSLKPANIVYVSCAPDTLSRDLQFFCGGLYKIVSIRLFDMFPRTPYFESLVHLSL